MIRAFSLSEAATRFACSTPGGIETVISSGTPDAMLGNELCSTPGGIETVISSVTALLVALKP